MTTPEQGFNARDTSEVPTKWKPGEIVIRDGNVLSFIEAEIEGEKWEILGTLAPYVHPDNVRRAETAPAGDADWRTDIENAPRCVPHEERGIYTSDDGSLYYFKPTHWRPVQGGE